MAISRSKKDEILKDITDKILRNKLVVFVNYRGISVSTLESIRKELRKEGIDFKVIKKTLLGRGLESAGVVADLDALDGQMAVAIGYNDEVLPAKVVHKFAKESENLKILAGIFENKFVDKEKIIALAQIPSKEELLAKIVGSINSPVAGFMNVLAGNIRGLVQVFNAIAQK